MPNPKTKAKQAPARSPKCFLRCSNEIILEIASYLGLQGLAVLLQASPDLQNVLHIPLHNLASSAWKNQHNPMTNSLNILEWVVQEGYAAVIQGLQASPKEHDFPCHAKNDALRLAAANGHLRCVDPLLSMGAELSLLPFIFPFAHYTPLQLVAKNGQLAMLELLLVRGAAPGTLSREYLTALEYALNINHKACARLLFKKSTRVELENCLSIAANMGRLGTVQVFLEKGVGKNGTRVIDGRILQHAVSKGNVECTRALYKHGAWFEPEALLQSAVIYGHEALVQFLLLERGDSCPGRTVYCRALEFSRWSILKLLLGSRVSAQGTRGDTALHFAAHIGDEKVVQLLLANGADASAPDEDGLRPLHYVAGAVSLHLIVYDDWVKKRVDLDKGHIRIIGMLLEKEACVSDTERFGLTAIDYAVRLDRESIVQCLKQGLEEE